MPNYQDSKIYKIVSPSRPDLLPYYGATTVALCKRMVGHRNLKLKPCKSRELLLVGDAIILLEENYPCNSKEELARKEAEYILNNPCCNRNIPLRTVKEWREDNAERFKEKSKEYYKENAEKYKEYRKEYRKENAEKYKEYRKENAEKYKEYRKENAEKYKEYMKEYYEENSEKIKEYTKEYYKENAEKIKEYTKEYRKKNKEQLNQKVLCECGSNVFKTNLSIHQKTKKHQKLLNQNLN